MPIIKLIHGPNLNMLGTRQPEIYGSTTLSTINDNIIRIIQDTPYSVDIMQSNSEEKIINAIHKCTFDSSAILIINPAAFGHTSLALRDALLCLQIPIIEVHLTLPKKREKYRKISFTRDLAMKVIEGKQENSYYHAIQTAIQYLEHKHGY